MDDLSALKERLVEIANHVNATMMDGTMAPVRRLIEENEFVCRSMAGR
jgi:hypothetical protein